MRKTGSTYSLFYALVLGGTGFIGSALINALQSRNHNVACLIHKRMCKQNIKLFSGSILTFPWSKLETSGMPDVIFHLARIPGKGPATRLAAAFASRIANQRLLHWLSTLASPPLLVLVAGTLAYGDHETVPVNETTPLHPLSYARQYTVGEQPIVREMNKKRLPIMVMRPAWVYGDQSWFRGFYLKPMKTNKVVCLFRLLSTPQKKVRKITEHFTTPYK
jgi:nucleoside-diphosphate-sugar epimerase